MGLGDVGRRAVLAGGAALSAAPAIAASGSGRKRRVAPAGFLWGTAISSYQSEGGNTNSDAWLMEHLQPSMFKEPSGDACDSYHRYAEDFAIAGGLGFNCHRFGVEWSRIEPAEGVFSNAALDHYARMLEACRARGLSPMITLNHFTTPLWFARRGGFEVADAPEIFARYCARVVERLGGLIDRVTTFNEANIRLLVDLMPGFSQALPGVKAAIAAAAQATNSPRFSRLAYADPKVASPIMQAAHRRAYEAIKTVRPELPVGITLTTQDVQAESEALVERYRGLLYGDWIEVANSHADFFGVQTYTRLRFDETGMLAPPPGAELTLSGYEFYPQALANTIRWAHAAIGKPIFVTESGVATHDDARRIAFIDAALDGLGACLDEGVPVHSYLYWSLLDNFEWTAGYGVPFGLVAVDRTSFKRTPRPSALHLGRRARANVI
ncbi:family 1 glycosylhydrolase [Caulobacter sp. 17J65-9]|uniref:glycoside hydrolase family 1 protein n=1 Tax=Caulobacter sp. 17J65-9 TaxID=2709382 RepID=UPI0013CB4CAE|nr:family 1 glycosylhydrolase [Caulobacter sp. 17J65-9]NEX94875.1 glycoside hydrolase family 1 protein [Caulobacter sp. 17J65-9]